MQVNAIYTRGGLRKMFCEVSGLAGTPTEKRGGLKINNKKGLGRVLLGAQASVHTSKKYFATIFIRQDCG